MHRVFITHFFLWTSHSALAQEVFEKFMRNAHDLIPFFYELLDASSYSNITASPEVQVHNKKQCAECA